MIARALATLSLLASAPVAAQTVAIIHGRVLTMGPAGEIADGTVILRDGKVVAVGAALATPTDARVIDAMGKIVTPGLVAPVTSLGLAELRSLAGPDDRSSTNDGISAAFDAGDGLNPDSVLIPVARLGGITRSIVTPGYDLKAGRTLLFAGQAAAVQLGSGGPMLVRRGVAMVLAMGEEGAERAGGSRGAALASLAIALDDVRSYARRRADYDRGETRALSLSRIDLEALIPVIEGRMPLLVTVNRASDIREMLAFAHTQRVKLILESASEGWRVAAEIARAGVPVLLTPIENVPASFEMLGATLSNAQRLHAAGVLIGFEGNGPDREREQRHNAGAVVAEGLPYAAALAAITINPARIFGLADRIGSLEPGKEGDAVIWDGDPLETASRPVAIFIRGVVQPMTSRQTELRDRYIQQVRKPQ
ncbi:amidohydrolase family protein [Sphingomonas alpina]|uniref:Amidohydrolase family protein n=1 Tax=Sphingomonas alpina TaxID=653931 RepID=A0A7H0LFS7_9SPHN|nr:amidohydrolase family protein [Sphingomonas alpina]QNQ08530.1 amidohydrolase family protein [Sphingomonas alpina]